MQVYNLVKYYDKYSKTSGCLCQYYRNEPAVDANDAINDL